MSIDSVHANGDTTKMCWKSNFRLRFMEDRGMRRGNFTYAQGHTSISWELRHILVHIEDLLCLAFEFERNQPVYCKGEFTEIEIPQAYLLRVTFGTMQLPCRLDMVYKRSLVQRHWYINFSMHICCIINRPLTVADLFIMFDVSSAA